jgi:hypothetical protein
MQSASTGALAKANAITVRNREKKTLRMSKPSSFDAPSVV